MKRYGAFLIGATFTMACGRPDVPDDPAPVAVEPAAESVMPEAESREARSLADSIRVPGVTLHGTLELPPAECPGPWPVALIIAGSGPTDRNGNSPLIPGQNNSLRMLAEGLAAECVASLRYDKRGVAASMAPAMVEDSLRFTTYADDAAAWLRRLDEDRHYDELVVIGHSEGAMLGTLAARQVDVDGVVLIAGAGRPIGVVLREQLRAQAPPALYAQADSILLELEAGRAVPDPPGALFALFRPSVQPYLISWLSVDPAAELAALDVPALVIWGTTDLQASRDDAERLAAADDDVELIVIEGMNHILKVVVGGPAEQMPSYGDPTLPLAPELVPAIGRFIQDL